VSTYRIDLAYEGTGFHGFARQAGLRTIQGDIEAALEQIIGIPVKTSCAGRTDKGVHARGQVVSFRAEVEMDVSRLQRSLNGVLGPEVGVKTVAMVPDGFDARHSACWRAYRYQILNSPWPDPLVRTTTWHLAEPLDVAAMDQLAKGAVGEHDFSSFCRLDPGRSLVREVLEAGWQRAGDLLVLHIRARSFCHQMVRSIVGTGVEAGRGKLDPAAMVSILAARNRAVAGQLAPANGLILWEVGY
jgi:tRNA pseudouridine38-40 synthase